MATIKESEIGIFSLNENRNRQIDEALIRNKENAKKIGGVATSTPDLASVMKGHIEEARKSNIDLVKESESLDAIESDEIRERFKQEFTNSETLFARINLTPPTPEQFEKAGVDYSNLAEEYEQMERLGLEPVLVVSPILRLKTLRDDKGSKSNQCWDGLYNKLSDVKNKQGNNLLRGLWIKNVEDGKGLDTEKVFNHEMGLIRNNKDIHCVTNQSDELTWTIALIPSTDKPQELDLPYSKHENQYNQLTNSQHLITSQYLTLQAIRIQSEMEPVDKVNKTFLPGIINYFTDTFLLSGCWDDDNKSLNIFPIRDSVSFHAARTGVRLPRWG